MVNTAQTRERPGADAPAKVPARRRLGAQEREAQIVEGAIDGAVSPRDSLSVRWGPPEEKARSRQEVVQAEVAAAAWLEAAADRAGL